MFPNRPEVSVARPRREGHLRRTFEFAEETRKRWILPQRLLQVRMSIALRVIVLSLRNLRETRLRYTSNRVPLPAHSRIMNMRMRQDKLAKNKIIRGSISSVFPRTARSSRPSVTIARVHRLF